MNGVNALFKCRSISTAARRVRRPNSIVAFNGSFSAHAIEIHAYVTITATGRGA